MPRYRIKGASSVELVDGLSLFLGVAGREEGDAAATSRLTALVAAGVLEVVDPDAPGPEPLPVRVPVYRRDDGTFEVAEGGGEYSPVDILGDAASDSEVAAAIAGIGGRFRGPWAATTQYRQGDMVLRPSDSAPVYAVGDHVSGGTYSAGSWTVLPLPTASGASPSASNTWTAQQTMTAPAASGGAGSPSHALRLLADTTDAGTVLRLGNRTPGQVAGGGTGYFRADIQWEIDAESLGSSARRWSAPAIDVGPSAGTGPGSRDGGSNLGFGDMVPIYRRDPVNVLYSQDIDYVPDERDPRRGIHTNSPNAQLHILKRRSGIPAVIVGDAISPVEDSWLLQFERQGVARGGFYKPETGPWAGFVGLKIGTNPAVPSDPLEVGGVAQVAALKLSSGFYTDYRLDVDRALIYGTGTGGSGVYPFNSSRHLVMHGGQLTGGTAADVVLASGRDALTPTLVVHGSSAATKNVSINADPAAPTALQGGGGGVLGIRNATTAPSSNPANGVALFQQSSVFNVLGPSGERTQIGLIGPSSRPGIGLNLARAAADVKLWRHAGTTYVAWGATHDLIFDVGMGPVVRSPDGLIVKRLGIDNAGADTRTTVAPTA